MPGRISRTPRNVGRVPRTDHGQDAHDRPPHPPAAVVGVPVRVADHPRVRPQREARQHNLRRLPHRLQILQSEKKESAVGFLKAALAYYASLGITVTRVMTDNGACYKAFAFRDACKDLGLKHIRTRPYTPKTNGKAERFIQTALREWAYAKAYPTSDRRAAELPTWLHRYNWHRPHGGLKSATPISKIGLDQNNLLSIHI